MKKILIFTLFAGLFSVLTAAEFKHPGFSCEDKNKITEALANADTPHRRTSMLILQKLAESTPQTFADFSKLVDDITAGVEFGSSQKQAKYRIVFKKQYVLFRDQCEPLRKDMIDFCIQNPSNFDAHVFMRLEKYLTAEQRYAGLRDCLMRYNYAPGITLNIVEQLVESGIGLENVGVKADLDKLNKKFSLKLVRDKAAWTPVVQNIRTALSTF